MKFIIDAQLPKNLSDLLNYRGCNSIHTLELLEKNATADKIIIKIAFEQKRIVVTKDADFLESFLLSSLPGKLIIVRTGNISNQNLLKTFDENLDLIKSMILRSNLVEITRTEIVEHE